MKLLSILLTIICISACTKPRINTANINRAYEYPLPIGLIFANDTGYIKEVEVNKYKISYYENGEREWIYCDFIKNDVTGVITMIPQHIDYLSSIDLIKDYWFYWSSKDSVNVHIDYRYNEKGDSVCNCTWPMVEFRFQGKQAIRDTSIRMKYIYIIK